MKMADSRVCSLRDLRSGRPRAPADDWGLRTGQSGKEKSEFGGARRGRLTGAAQGANYVEARTI